MILSKPAADDYTCLYKAICLNLACIFSLPIKYGDQLNVYIIILGKSLATVGEKSLWVRQCPEWSDTKTITPGGLVMSLLVYE